MAKNYTIRLKLVVPLAVFMIAIAVFNSTYFPTRQSSLINKNFHERMEQAIGLLTLGTSISIASQNLDGAALTIDRIKEDPNLAFLLVLAAVSG
jgi:hypothetical protein